MGLFCCKMFNNYHPIDVTKIFSTEFPQSQKKVLTTRQKKPIFPVKQTDSNIFVTVKFTDSFCFARSFSRLRSLTTRSNELFAWRREALYFRGLCTYTIMCKRLCKRHLRQEFHFPKLMPNTHIRERQKGFLIAANFPAVRRPPEPFRFRSGPCALSIFLG